MRILATFVAAVAFTVLGLAPQAEVQADNHCEAKAFDGRPTTGHLYVFRSTRDNMTGCLQTTFRPTGGTPYAVVFISTHAPYKKYGKGDVNFEFEVDGKRNAGVYPCNGTSEKLSGRQWDILWSDNVCVINLRAIGGSGKNVTVRARLTGDPLKNLHMGVHHIDMTVMFFRR